jgi:hypothetical protein
MEPAPYREAVPGGERVMVGIRAFSDAVSAHSRDTLGVSVDYFTTRKQGGILGRHVDIANRHREVIMTIGTTTAKVWTIDPQTGEKVRQSDFVMDVAPRIVDGRTWIPLRFAVELLNGSVISISPEIRLSYGDPIAPFDFRMAEAAMQGAKAAYETGLITLGDLYFLRDYKAWSFRQGAEINTLALFNPLSYIRFSYLMTEVMTGHAPTDAEVDATAVFVNLHLPAPGGMFTGSDVREIGKVGDRSGRIVAEKYNLKEGGYDDRINEWVDFKEYNKQKYDNQNSNGPDQMFTLNDPVTDFIVIHLPFENKATTTPWVRPSRYAENTPFRTQVDRLVQRRDAIVQREWGKVQRSLDEADRLFRAGEYTAEQFEAVVQEIRTATSVNGGASEAFETKANEEGALFAGLDFDGNIARTNIFFKDPREKR